MTAHKEDLAEQQRLMQEAADIPPAPRLTKRRLEAMQDAVTAMLAGDGEGDAEGVDFKDLSAAADWIADQLYRRKAKR